MAQRLRGTIRVPSDKSLSHRAVLFGALGEGTTEALYVLKSEDVDASIGAVRALGASVVVTESTESYYHLEITGWGAKGPVSPDQPIDCGNSGTTARILMGLIAGYPIKVTLIGDSSLSKRPMLRVAEPLQLMGATVELSDTGTLPATITGSDSLTPLTYRSPHASAQVKTALALAAFRAQGQSRISEPTLSRTMTEELAPAFGLSVATGYSDAEPFIEIDGPQLVRASTVSCAADPSSAAFFAVGAAIVPMSRVQFDGVYLNPTRLGFLKVMKDMGCDVSVEPISRGGNVSSGTITVTFTEGLRASLVQEALVASLIDEVPILALLATQAKGTTRFEGVSELRHKESNRLECVADGLAQLGATVRYGEDWLEVDGPTTLVAPAEPFDVAHDHRLAMTWTIASLISSTKLTLTDPSIASVSYPTFYTDLERLQNGLLK